MKKNSIVEFYCEAFIKNRIVCVCFNNIRVYFFLYDKDMLKNLSKKVLNLFLKYLQLLY